MMLKQNWESYGLPSELFKGGIPLSPIFEPEVVMRTSINEDVRLTLDMARIAIILVFWMHLLINQIPSTKKYFQSFLANKVILFLKKTPKLSLGISLSLLRSDLANLVFK